MSSLPEAGERLVRSLATNDVDYLFGTFGTDHPPIIRGLDAVDGPELVLAPDEMVGASAAHGYAQVTGDPQAVLVHVDVGTTNLGPALHNAARSRVPMFVLAGRTPHTTRGDQPGGRSIFVHYYQDVFDQPGLVREYTKWAYELETPANVEQVVARGLDRARTDPPGPTYLALPREILRGEAEPAEDPTAFSTDTDPTRTSASRETIDDLVDWIEAADHPLRVKTCAGRDAEAVHALERFAVTAGVPVVEAAPAFRMNFPRDHPLHLGFMSEPHLDESDLVIVANSDVPWVPARGTPNADARVVRIDPDPHATQYPLPDAPADVSIAADPATVLAEVTAVMEGQSAGAADRIDRFRDVHAGQRREWADAVPDPDTAAAITPALLSRTLGDVLDPEAVVVDETVTNTVGVLRHTERSAPGTYYSYCSSGLGWALGASVGIKLARPDATVVTTVGDGSFVFGNPLATIQMVHALDLPHLTIIYDNENWQAVGNAVRDQYGADPGFDPEPFTQFQPGTNYAAMAEGLDCYGDRVRDPTALPDAIDEALDAVDSGTHAILDVMLEDEPRA